MNSEVNNKLQDSDFEWFRNNLTSLYKKYGDTYLAIKDKKVLGSYKTSKEGIAKTKLTEELGSFIVTKCGVDSNVYTAHLSNIGVFVG